ncbi:4'-phosphopantetheinyl transferase superfamily protein [Phaeobacter sp. HF9A]|uniref:4'-phosphopantetheinyl transferase family protein n=1 Tax=Phaeobacter sp. HF9A TaxID=2721561 RepID=UPI0014322F22|nr:4'-phosphopantetheinyl transferase superfamily protein [Phaeobacter sp. HF9A]NIZ13563.1 4'-phosphopantetheinyl transferase superfamily protein [Phaeobacter sp. HF9A]
MSGAAIPVDLWCARVRPLPREAQALLSQAEQQRLGQILGTEERAAYVSAHLLKRHVLAQHLKCSPAAVRLKTGWNGRPELCDARALSFNLSHSGGYVALAVCAEAPVGVDIEQVRPRPSARRVVERLFAPEEKRLLLTLAEGEFASAFLRLWTLKEAFIKATGEGLARSLSSFAIDWRQPRLLRGAAQPYALAGFSLGTSYCGSLAAGGGLSMTLRKMDATALLNKYT